MYACYLETGLGSGAGACTSAIGSGPRGLKNGVVELTCRKTGDSEELISEAAIAKVIAQYM